MKRYSTLGGFVNLNLAGQLPYKITMDLCDDGINYQMKMFTKGIVDGKEENMCIETLSRLPSNIELTFDTSKPENEQVFYSITIPEECEDE